MNIFGRPSNLRSRHKYNFIILFFSFFFIIIPSAALAHVKWFVTNEGSYANTHFQADFVSISLVSGFIFFIFFCYIVDVKASHVKTLQHLLYGRSGRTYIVWAALKLSVAILFTANIIQNNFIAPNFVDYPSKFQIAAQGLLLVTLIVHADIFALLLVLFAVFSLFFYPFSSSIDYCVELAALAFAIYFSHPSRINRSYKYRLGIFFMSDSALNIGLTALRIGLGLQLIILSLHDKFFHPGLALKFLSTHPEFNFVRFFGVTSFSDLHFVLAAGLAELAFGVLLATNIAARIGLILILFFFVTTGVVLGVEELVGHVPIVVAALVLFLFPAHKSIYIGALADQWQDEVNAPNSDASQKL